MDISLPLLFRRRLGVRAAITPLLLGLLGLGAVLNPALAQNSNDSAGAKGAQVYCYMRANGNNHEVSWAAAYALIKRQGASMFRTSPEHGAVMITEAVVQNPTNFPDCGRYLGDLFSRNVNKSATIPAAPSGTASTASTADGFGQSRSGR